MDELTTAAQQDKISSLAAMQSEIKATESMLDRLIEKQQTVVEKQTIETAQKHGYKKESVPDAVLNFDLSQNKGFTELENQINAAGEKLEALKAKEKSVESQTAQSVASQSGEYGKLNTQLNRLTTRQEQYQYRMQQAVQTTNANSKATGSLKTNLQKIGNKFVEVGNKAVSFFGKNIKKGLSAAGNSMKNMMSHTGKAGNSVSKLFDRIKSLAGAAFIFNVLRKAFSAMSTYLGGAVNSNKQFTNSLAQVKGNLLTAFAPIFEAVMPALNALMGVLAKITGYIAAFVSMLFGKTISASQSSAKALNNQAAAYGNAGNAAKKAAGALASFDEINVLQSQEDSSGGGGGSGASASTPDFSMDLSAMEDYFAKFDSLKEAFYNIGASIAESINGVLSKIDWVSIQNKVAEWSTALAALFNGFVDKLDWRLLGTSIGEGINTILVGANTFVREFNWGNLATSITEGLNSAISTINWKEVGVFFSNGIRIAIDMLYNFVNTFNWKKMGESLSIAVNSWFESIDWGKGVSAIQTGIIGLFTTIQTLIKGIKWKEIGTTIGEAFSKIDWPTLLGELATTLSDAASGLLDILLGLLKGIDWIKLGEDIWNSLVAMVKGIDWGGLIAKAIELMIGVIASSYALIAGIGKAIAEGLIEAISNMGDYFGGYIEDAGGNIILGLLNGILDALASISQWIMENIFTPILNGIKSAFGIHSPSTVMAEMGTFLMEGLIQGIVEMIASVLTTLNNLFTQMKTAVLTAWETIKTSLSTILENIKTKFTEIFTAIRDKVAEIWQTMKDKISEIWQAITEYIGNKVEAIRQIVTTIFENVKTVASNIWNGLKDKISEIVDTMKDKLKEKVNSIKSTFTDVFTAMKEKVVGIFEGIWNGIKGVINNILSGIESMANGVVNGINTMINALNNLHFDIPDWVPGFGGNSFGINIPNVPNVSIPKLANGAVIPANREFMAVLGDQKNGTNLEAPEGLIRQIVREESGQGDVVVKISGNLGALARVLRIEAEKEDSRIGIPMIGGAT